MDTNEKCKVEAYIQKNEEKVQENENNTQEK
jgi:hypothetical protein